MKTSNKLAIAMTVLFIILPAIGYLLIRGSMASANSELTTVATGLSSDTIRVVHITGERATPGLLSVSPVQYEKSEINLNVQPGAMSIKNDTLYLHLDDNSRIYQGYIHVKNLKSAIINSDTIIYKTTKL